MSQHDFNIANADGATVRADLNAAFQAAVEQSGGAAAPTTTFANMWWFDETNDILKQRDEANTAWINVASKVGTNWVPYRNGTLLGDAAEKTVGTSAGQLPLADDADLQGIKMIPIHAKSFTARTTSPALAAKSEMTTNKNMVEGFDFDAATEEFVQIAIPMPKSWNEGTIQVEFLWTAASGSGDVIWKCAAVAIGDSDPLDVAFGTAQSVTDTLLTALDLHHSARSSAITVAGTPAEDDMLQLQISRDAAAGGDTLAVDATLIGIRLVLTTNAGNDA